MDEKRIALVTGANRGIGFETCRQLAQHGIKVLLGARNEVRGRVAAEELRNEDLDVEAILLNVADSKRIAKVRGEIEERFGRLDILVNNAGMAHPEESLFGNSAATVSMEALRETFDVNFFGLVELTRELLPLIKKSPAGRIVNVSSMLGSLTLHADPEGGIEQIKPLAYDASKAAVNMFTIHLAQLLRDTPVKVNSAHPGWVKTDMGGEEAPMEIVDGARTSVALATLDEYGPTGGFFHMGDKMPW